jgi:hypothetical protein
MNYSFIGGDRSGWVRIFDKSKWFELTEGAVMEFCSYTEEITA